MPGGLLNLISSGNQNTGTLACTLMAFPFHTLSPNPPAYRRSVFLS